MSPEPLCTPHLALPSAKVAEPNTPCSPPSLRCAAAAAADLHQLVLLYCIFHSLFWLCHACCPLRFFSRLHIIQNLESSNSFCIVRPSFLVFVCHFKSGHSQCNNMRIAAMPHFGSQHCGVIVNLTIALCAIAFVHPLLTS